jgi:hypothetical protein
MKEERNLGVYSNYGADLGGQEGIVVRFPFLWLFGYMAWLLGRSLTYRLRIQSHNPPDEDTSGASDYSLFYSHLPLSEYRDF